MQIMLEMWQETGRKQGGNILTPLFSHPLHSCSAPYWLYRSRNQPGASHLQGSPGIEHRGERLRIEWGEGMARGEEQHILFAQVFTWRIFPFRDPS